MSYEPLKNITLYDSDIPEEYADLARKDRVIAWDIETSGLDWQKDLIATCQLCVANRSIAIVRVGKSSPKRLISLLADPSIKKVFHHAMFDLRFMAYHWAVLPQNISCTKIASKLLNENSANHSLKSLLKQHLGIVIEKDQQTSDWLSKKLSPEQVAYAATDVVYLIHLLDVLERELGSKGRLTLAHKCFDHIPTRVQLDILRYPDVYVY